MTQTEANQLKADIGILIDSYVDGAPPANPIITLFVYDANGNLTWETANGQNASLNGGEFDNQQVDLQDSIPVIVLVDTTFWLTVTGEPGTTPATASVTVTATTLPDVEYIGPGLVEYEEKHIHQGKRTEFRPGTEYRRIDVPPSNPGHANGGIMNEGELIALRGPNDAPIIFSSQNPNGHRAHVMTTGPGISQARGIVGRDIGRTLNAPLSSTNPIGLYPWHFHLCGDSPSSFIEDSEFYDTVPSLWRHAIVLHATNLVRVANNHIHHKGGSGIYLEDGTETGNLIHGNLIEDIVGTGERPDAGRPLLTDKGFAGHGIYSTGGLNSIRNNTVRRCTRSNVCYFHLTTFTPVLDCEGNTLESTNWNGIGIEYWELGWQSGAASVFKGNTLRGFYNGVYGYRGKAVCVEGGLIEGCHTGAWTGDYENFDWLVKGTRFVGNRFGIMAPYLGHNWRVEDAEFAGSLLADVLVGSLYTAGHGSNCRPRRGVLARCKFSPKAVMMQRSTSGFRNYVALDETFIEDANGVAGDTFQAFYPDQLPTAPMPHTESNHVGCPVAGLTVQQSWDQYGLTFAGAVMPAGAVQRPGFGWVKN